MRKILALTACLGTACAIHTEPSIDAGTSIDAGSHDAGVGGDAGNEPTGDLAWAELAADPVVVEGATVPALLGTPLDKLSAWRIRGGMWTQIPLQVDERVYRRIDSVYASPADVAKHFASDPPTVFAWLAVYADANTWVGADTDPTFDADDEASFLAGDSGEARLDGSTPPGLQALAGAELRVVQAGVAQGHVYLFRTAETVDPSAGRASLSLSFTGTRGGKPFGIADYRTGYNPFPANPANDPIACGGQRWPIAQPEDTTLTTPSYQRHFSGRWLSDGLSLRESADGGYGPDFLDLHQARFALDYCGRSVSSFSGAEGAILTLRSGPIRALRAQIGANSGVFTVRTYQFFPGMEVVDTDLRVHELGDGTTGFGIMDLTDYNAAAVGMRYYSASTPAEGLLIDGVADPEPAGGYAFSPWEAVSGTPGTTLSELSLITSQDSLHAALKTRFQDSAASATCTCNDTAGYYGLSGMDLQQPMGLGCTDPMLHCPHGEDHAIAYLRFHRTVRYRPGAMSASDLEALRAKTEGGLAVSARPLAGGDFVLQAANVCGDGVCRDHETSLWCPSDCPVP